jgi:hypothetical protein
MNLQNIVCDAAGGFALGLAWGLKDPGYNIQKAVEFIEAVPEEKRKEFGIKTATPETITHMKNLVFSGSVGIPYIIGGLYSTAVHVANQTPFSENLIATVPSTYLGYFAGKGIRLVRDRKERRQTKTLKQILQDPDNAEQYAISEEQRQTIQTCLSEIEKHVLNRNKDMKKYTGQIEIMYQTLTENPGPYTGFLLDRNLKKVMAVIKKAHTKRELREFYDAEVLEGVPESFRPIFQRFEKEFVRTSVVEEPSEPKFKVFVKQGDEFYVMSVNFDKLRVIRKDNYPLDRIETGGRQINLSKRTRWNGDYDALNDRLQTEKPGYTIMLMDIPENCPDATRNEIATAGFLEAYSSHLRKQDLETERREKVD